MRWLVLVLLLGWTLPSAHAAPEEKAPGPPGVEKTFNDLYPVAFRQRVNHAIDRGRDWLLKSQRADGSWSFFSHHRHYPMGCTALALLTLLKCGLPPDHPAIEKGFAFLKLLELRSTYSVSVLLMALDARYAPARDPFAIEDVDRYGKRTRKDPCANQIRPEDKAWMEQGVAFLLSHQQAEGIWRYPSGGYDTSNTQFALLGLHAATRCGVQVRNQVWVDALRYLLDFQQKEGEPVLYEANEVRGRYRFEWTERAIARGFKYSMRETVPSASMTNAGLTALVICQSRLWRSRAFTGALRAETRRAVRDAMAWLQANFAVDHNPGGSATWTFYNLYGVERAGVLGRFRFLGTHDWYFQGATFLLEWQRGDGSFNGRNRGEDSCFALLFLKRATSRMDAPVITPSGSKEGEMPPSRGSRRKQPAAPTGPDSPTALALAVARAIRRLDDPDPDVVFLAARRLGQLGHRRAVVPLLRIVKLHDDDDARVASVHALGVLRAADAVPVLIGTLDDPDPLVRHAAERALRSITLRTPTTLLRQTASRNDRIRLQRDWRAWWKDNEDAVRVRLKQPRTP